MIFFFLSLKFFNLWTKFVQADKKTALIASKLVAI
jgi:hypothetical protein